MKLKHIFSYTLAFAIPAGFLFLGSCGDSEEALPAGTVAAELNGEFWLSTQATATLANVGNNEVRLTISGLNNSNEGIFAGVTTAENNLLRMHEITSQQNGEFIAYRPPGTTSVIESHSSFGCGSITGEIIITEYNPEERYVSGFFDGQICRGDGTDPLLVSAGEFVRIKF